MSSTILHFLSILIASIIILSGVHGRSIPKDYKGKNEIVYDCVDFLKQPAFSQSSLNNHTSKIYQQISSRRKQSKGNFFNGGKGACPSGTVPIIRTHKNNSFSILDEAGHCTAVVRTTDQNMKFYGAEGSPSTNKPKVSGAQWSAARMKLSNGGDSVEVGWMVNPSVYKDEEAHLYVRFQNGQGSCLNTDCPGWVQVAQDLPLGTKPDRYSQYGGQQYTWKLFIDKHQDDGNWWVSSDDDKYAIGYWPKSLFSGLADHATQVEWGGEVGNPDNVNPVPEMGYGTTPALDSSKTAFFQHITVVDESFHNVNPNSAETHWDCAGYTPLDWGDQGPYWGYLIFYGGPPNQ